LLEEAGFGQKWQVLAYSRSKSSLYQGHSLKNVLLSAILLLLVSISIIAGIEHYDQYRLEQASLRDIEDQLELHSGRLEATLDSIVRLNRQLSAETAANPMLASNQLQRFAEKLISEQPRIASVVITRKLKVIFVHPTKGNETVIGMDYGLHPEFMSGIKRALESRSTVVDASAKLLQTGKPGLIVRAPVFIPTASEPMDELWGLVSMGVDLEGLLIEAGFLDPAQTFALAIRSRVDGQINSEIWGDPLVFQRAHVTTNVILPDGQWELGAAPKLEAGYSATRSRLIRGIGILVTFVLMLTVLQRKGLINNNPRSSMAGSLAEAQSTASSRIPLRVIVLVALLLPVPLMVGISGWFSYKTSMRAAEQLEQQQVVELGNQIRDKVTSFFEVPRRVATFNAEQFRAGFLEPQKQKHLLRNFLLQLRQQPLLTFLSMGTAEGEYFAASRPPLGDERALRVLQATIAQNRVMNIYRADDASRPSTLLAVGNAYFDARTRPWFKVAVAADSIKWYPAYRYVIQDGPGVYDAMGMGMSAPLYDANHRFIGVVTADVALSQLSAFLKAQMSSIGGVAFLAEAGGELLASSGTEPIYRLDGDKTIRIRASESDTPAIRIVGSVIKKSTDSAGNQFVEVNGERYLVDWQTIQLPDGPALTIGLALPESRFAGPAEEAFLSIGYLTLAFWGLGIVAALFATNWFARPLVSLSHWAKQLAGGDWQAKPPMLSPIHEIASLTCTLGYMADNLKLHTEELERRVVERTEELENANRQLAKLSVTDGLTGIANRRHFDEVYADEFSRAARNGQPLTLMMLDVDLFKKYNDHYGHQAGDEALKRVAAVLSDNARRPADLAARYGGEEFSIIAANTDRSNAKQIAETIRSAIEALAIPHEQSAHGKVTVSIGVAVLSSESRVSLEQLLTMADEALYRAKAAGRNRAEIAKVYKLG